MHLVNFERKYEHIIFLSVLMIFLVFVFLSFFVNCDILKEFFSGETGLLVSFECNILDKNLCNLVKPFLMSE